MQRRLQPYHRRRLQPYHRRRLLPYHRRRQRRAQSAWQSRYTLPDMMARVGEPVCLHWDVVGAALLAGLTSSSGSDSRCGGALRLRRGAERGVAASRGGRHCPCLAAALALLRRADGFQECKYVQMKDT